MTIFDGRLDGIRNRLKASTRRRKEKQKEPSSNEDHPLFHQTPNSAATSSLFRLPPEVREQIWHHLIGDRALHISNPSNPSSSQQVTHIICRAPISTILAPYVPTTTSSNPTTSNSSTANLHRQLELEYRDSTTIIFPPSLTPAVNPQSDPRFRHSGCFIDSRALIEAAKTPDPIDLDSDLRETISRARLPLAILRTCRTIHAEASRILWTDNWFMFAKSHTFINLLSHRTPIQLNWIRHVVLRPIPHLCFASVPPGPQRWSAPNYPGISIDPIWKEALGMLTGLRELCLTARYDVTVEEVERIWVYGDLEGDKGGDGEGKWGGKEVGIELIDDLREKKGLAWFWPQVPDSTIWCRDPRDEEGRYILRKGDERLNRLLEGFLRERVTGKRGIGTEGEKVNGGKGVYREEGIEIEEREKRRKSYEEYAREVLKLPWLSE